MTGKRDKKILPKECVNLSRREYHSILISARAKLMGLSSEVFFFNRCWNKNLIQFHFHDFSPFSSYIFRFIFHSYYYDDRYIPQDGNISNVRRC